MRRKVTYRKTMILGIVFIALIAVGVFFGTKPQKSNDKLDLNKLVLEDGSYGWNGIALNSSREEVEAVLKKDLGDKVKTQYGFDFYVPAQIQYKDHNGDIVFLFRNDRLMEIHIDFRPEDPVNGGKEAVDKVARAYEEILAELQEIYGEYDCKAHFGDERGWFSDVSIGDGLLSRLEIDAYAYEAYSESAIVRLRIRTVPDERARVKEAAKEDAMGQGFAQYLDMEEEQIIASMKDLGYDPVCVEERTHQWQVTEEMNGFPCTVSLNFYDIDEDGIWKMVGYSKYFDMGDSIDWNFVRDMYTYMTGRFGNPTVLDSHFYGLPLVENEYTEEYDPEYFEFLMENKKVTFRAEWSYDSQYGATYASMTLRDDKKMIFSENSPEAHEYMIEFHKNRIN